MVTDNGSEFTRRAFDAWVYARGVQIEFIQPGKPVQKCFIESFHGSLRDECLKLHWFQSRADARRTIGAWRRDYNRVRRHNSLEDITTVEYLQTLTEGGAKSITQNIEAVRL